MISDYSKLSFTIPVSVVNEEAHYYTQEGVFESVKYKYVWKTENIDTCTFKNNLSGSSEILNNECMDEDVDVLVNRLENWAS